MVRTHSVKKLNNSCEGNQNIKQLKDDQDVNK